MDYEERKKEELENKIIDYYKEMFPSDYAELKKLRENANTYPAYKVKKNNIIERYRSMFDPNVRNSNDYLLQKPDDVQRRNYDLSGIPSNLTEDKSKAIGLKTEIENHILEKLSDYIISKHPRGTYTKTAYQIAIVNVLKNIFKDPNNDIITYIETKLKGEPEKKSTFSFFGFGGTKRKRKRKSRRR